MRFRVVLKGGKELPFKVNLGTSDPDVAKYRAEKTLGIHNISHVVAA